MGRVVLRTDVYVNGVRFAAGTAEAGLPKGVSITNPKAWIEAVLDATEPEEVVEEPDTGAGDADPQFEMPPANGKGSGVKAWAEFAKNVGVDVAENATKDEILQALQDAGVIEAE